jgi:hypothetical protein
LGLLRVSLACPTLRGFIVMNCAMVRRGPQGCNVDSYEGETHTCTCIHSFKKVISCSSFFLLPPFFLPLFLCFAFLRWDLSIPFKLVLNPWTQSSRCSLLSAGTTGMYHHTQLSSFLYKSKVTQHQQAVPWVCTLGTRK